MEPEPISRADSTSPAESNEDGSPITFETREELLAAIQKQVEYYFSKENLQTDAFLVTRMDANMSVPISVVMKFSKMRRLTQSEADLVEALSTSKSVHIVDDKIKANIKQERNTIILREIASNTPDAEIIAIFDGVRPVKNVRSDVGDTWFVSFENEEDAREALLAIRNKTFNGQSIKARLKVENILRSFYTPPAPGLDGVPVTGPMAPFGVMGGFPPSAVVPPFPMFGGDRNAAGVAGKPGSASGRSGDKGSAKGGKDSRERGSKKSGQSPTGAATPNRKDSRRGRTEKGRGDRKGDDNRSRSDSSASRSGLNFTAANFPPLPLVETPVPQAGYEGPFIEYTVDELLRIVQRISKDDAKLPEDLNPADHPQAMDLSPNMDLLLRQRTFSIDETREQLRQGRPVQREAVIAGGVDYGALMYGEHDEQKHVDSDEAIAAAAAAAVAAATASSAAPSAGAKPQGYAAVLMAGAQTTPVPATPTKAAVKAPSSTQKQPQAAAAKATPKASSEKEKAPVAAAAKAGKAGKRAKGTRGGEREAGEAQTNKNGKSAKKTDEEQADKPSSWGGRPTFVDVLRKQESAEPAPAPGKPAERATPNSVAANDA